jgi:Ran-binding protein 3
LSGKSAPTNENTSEDAFQASAFSGFAQSTDSPFSALGKTSGNASPFAGFGSEKPTAPKSAGPSSFAAASGSASPFGGLGATKSPLGGGFGGSTGKGFGGLSGGLSGGFGGSSASPFSSALGGKPGLTSFGSGTSTLGSKPTIDTPSSKKARPFGAAADDDEEDASDGGSDADEEDEQESSKQMGTQDEKKDERFHEQDGKYHNINLMRLICVQY